MPAPNPARTRYSRSQPKGHAHQVLGAVVHLARALSGISRENLAARCGLSPAAIADAERGQAGIDVVITALSTFGPSVKPLLEAVGISRSAVTAELERRERARKACAAGGAPTSTASPARPAPNAAGWPVTFYAGIPCPTCGHTGVRLELERMPAGDALSAARVHCGRCQGASPAQCNLAPVVLLGHGCLLPLALTPAHTPGAASRAPERSR